MQSGKNNHLFSLRIAVQSEETLNLCAFWTGICHLRVAAQTPPAGNDQNSQWCSGPSLERRSSEGGGTLTPIPLLAVSSGQSRIFLLVLVRFLNQATCKKKKQIHWCLPGILLSLSHCHIVIRAYPSLFLTAPAARLLPEAEPEGRGRAHGEREGGWGAVTQAEGPPAHSDFPQGTRHSGTSSPSVRLAAPQCHHRDSSTWLTTEASLVRCTGSVPCRDP